MAKVTVLGFFGWRKSRGHGSVKKMRECFALFHAKRAILRRDLGEQPY